MPAERAAWRCDGCGRVSNAAVMPRAHRRAGQDCGPFSGVTIAADGAVLVERAAPPRPTTYRQSSLRSFETCPRRALHDLQLPDDLSVGNVEASAALGSATHAVFHEILATLRQQGAVQMPTQEGVEVMYEVLAKGNWVLPADERDELRGFVLSFCSYYEWAPNRIMALEKRLSMDIVCPDGKTRTLTGQPDVIISDAPDGLVIVDYKTGQGKPKSPRKEPPKGEAIIGREYLSAGGTFQLDVYGLLAMHAYPAAQRVTLREAWIRFGERREAVLGRSELEHVVREIAVQMMLLDRAIDEGPESKLARPRPGRHCLKGCPVKRSCPIPAEQRGLGALDSPDAADAEAARFRVIDSLRQEQRDALKAHHEETGYAPDVGDGTVLRWAEKPGGGRAFGFHQPVWIDPAEQAARDAEFLAGMERSIEERMAEKAGAKG